MALERHLDGILAYCHHKVPFGVVEAINGNIRSMIRRGRGYRDHKYLILKVQRATARARLARAAWIHDGLHISAKSGIIFLSVAGTQCVDPCEWTPCAVWNFPADRAAKGHLQMGCGSPAPYFKAFSSIDPAEVWILSASPPLPIVPWTLELPMVPVT